MKSVNLPLTRNMVAIIDEDDLQKAMLFTWHYSKKKTVESMQRKLILLNARRKRLKAEIGKSIGLVAGIEFAIAEYEKLFNDNNHHYSR